MIFKSKGIRLNIGIMFSILAVMMIVGLYGVEREAKQYATNKAAVIVAKQQKVKHEEEDLQIRQQSWETNHTACGIRAFVVPSLHAAEQTLIRAKAASKDTTTSASSRKRSQAAVIATQKQITSTKKVLALFGTIPPGLDCTKLAPRPPVV